MDKETDRILRKAAAEYRETARRERPDNAAIEETILLAQRIVAGQHTVERLSYLDFMLLQMRLIKKQWWALQGGVLLLAWAGLVRMGTSWYAQRGMSIMAALFVILAIPELWKNRETKAVEIEEASYYNLRHIYVAKILSFGFVDIILLSVFGIITVSTQEYLVADFMKQFIFPAMIATVLCLAALSCSNKLNELPAAVLCMVINAVWMAVTMNDAVYDMITPAIWIAMFLTGCLIITLLIRSLSRESHRCSEVI